MLHRETLPGVPSLSNKDNIAPSALLLGYLGWPNPQWEGNYFPDDLPDDWQFAFYSNDCSCLALPSAFCAAMDKDELTDWLDDIEASFRFYLQGDQPIDLADELTPFLGGFLLPEVASVAPQDNCFYGDAETGWKDSTGRLKIACWNLDGKDLRAQRGLLEGLPQSVETVLVQGDGVSPEQLRQLRTLAEMLGRY